MKIKAVCSGCGKPLHTHECVTGPLWKKRTAHQEGRPGEVFLLVNHNCGSTQAVARRAPKEKKDAA